MKRLGFISSNRVHLARQQILLNELKNYCEVKIFNYSPKKNLPIADIAIDITKEFNKWLNENTLDALIVRGDRYEILGPTMVAFYKNIPIIHIEGFDLSGTWDNQIRYALSYLSTTHFVTNVDSYQRALSMGFKNVWNYGSLDCEYALKCSQTLETAPGHEQSYIIVLYHSVPNEDATELFNALEQFPDYTIIGIKGNRDYGKQLYNEEYSPEEFIRLLNGASCLVGNSSAGIKEASVLGIPVVNIGSRQQNRLKPSNVVDVPCRSKYIELGIEYQLGVERYQPDHTYYKKDTSKKIAETICQLVSKSFP